MKKKWKYFIGFLIALGIIGMIAFILIPAGLVALRFSGIATPVEITGTNMEPNYRDGQRWIVDEKYYSSNIPQRGDVVVYKIGEGPDEKWRIQRIIGMPNEKIMVKEGQVYINGGLFEDPYKKSSTLTNPSSFLTEGVEITVPANSYFVMGDNRPNSSDSRTIGPIPLDRFVGKITTCYKGCN